MTEQQQATMRQALEALEHMCMHTRSKTGYRNQIVGKAMDDLRQALSADALEQQPAAPVKVWDADGYDALMQELEMWQAKAQKPAAWVGLTDEERKELCGTGINGKVFQEISRMVEAKLREKNTR